MELFDRPVDRRVIPQQHRCRTAADHPARVQYLITPPHDLPTSYNGVADLVLPVAVMRKPNGQQGFDRLLGRRKVGTAHQRLTDVTLIVDEGLSDVADAGLDMPAGNRDTSDRDQVVRRGCSNWFHQVIVACREITVRRVLGRPRPSPLAVASLAHQLASEACPSSDVTHPIMPLGDPIQAGAEPGPVSEFGLPASSMAVAVEYPAGRLLRELAELTGRTQTAIRRALDELGIPRRGRGAAAISEKYRHSRLTGRWVELAAMSECELNLSH